MEMFARNTSEIFAEGKFEDAQTSNNDLDKP